MSDVIDIQKAPSKKKSLNTYVMLPVTMQQFEDLTNDLLAHINEAMAPNAADGEYVAQILMGVIHSGDRKSGKVRKEELFEGCINTISRHVTYHACEEIQKRIKERSAQTGDPVVTKPLETPDVGDGLLQDEVSGQMPDPPAPPAA